jgi:ABC-2 type transport system ATP-binding protein
LTIISVQKIVKEYRQYKRFSGFWGSLRNLITQEYTVSRAVEDISFSISQGEAVGYLGPNGAGKSTMIKMLTGILVPSSGYLEVRGNIPHKKRRENNRHIGVVFGQRSQLWWDLPVIDSFDMHRHIYKLSLEQFKYNLQKYVELLDMGPFLQQPVRQLSLGQRMRAEIALALLHDPEILFLDEPTIGLDIMAKDRIRAFLRSVNRERKVTIILTTHDMHDIEEICPRLLIVNKGRLVYDGAVQQLKTQFGTERKVTIEFADSPGRIEIPGATLVSDEDRRKQYIFSRGTSSVLEQLSKLSEQFPIADVTMQESGIEDVIRTLYHRLNDEGSVSEVHAKYQPPSIQKKVLDS